MTVMWRAEVAWIYAGEGMGVNKIPTRRARPSPRFFTLLLSQSPKIQALRESHSSLSFTHFESTGTMPSPFPGAASTSAPELTASPLFFCRWDYCTLSLSSLSALSSHLREHISLERPVYVPAHKRRRRDDGAWCVDDDTSTTLNLSNLTNLTDSSLPHLNFSSREDPSHLGSHLDSVGSQSRLDSQIGSNLASAIASRAASVSEHVNANANANELEPFLPPANAILSDLGLEAEVDYDAFLRSPSPPPPLAQSPSMSMSLSLSMSQPSAGQRFPVSSTPLSQIPPPTQTQPSPKLQLQRSHHSQQPPSQTRVSDASSGALVSPPNSMPAPTQPPTQPSPQTPGDSSGISASPRTTPLQFGAAETPRRVSAGGVGFDWGTGK